MKDGPMLTQFHKRSGRAYKRFAAYAYGIFKKSYISHAYMCRYAGTYLYFTAKYPRLFYTVPRLRYGIQSIKRYA